MFEDSCARYLDAVDAALPGLVTGLYVVGSAALGAWRPDLSDVDTVILTSRALSAADIARLATVHAEILGKPYFDGVYLDPEAAAAWPDDQRVNPFVVGGEFKTGVRCGELNPVVWHVLKNRGIAVRGPAVDDLAVRVDPARLRAYNLDNLRGYWQKSVARFPEYLAKGDPGDDMDPETVSWFTLGPARLHYTLAHGEVVSKVAAGEYVRATFPEFGDLARQSIAYRNGEPVTFTAADLGTAGELVNVIADDAWRRCGKA